MGDHAEDCFDMQVLGGHWPDAHERCAAPLTYNTTNQRTLSMAKAKRQTATNKRPKPKRTTRTSSPKKTATTGGGFCGKSPLGMFLYGPSGVGKTSVAANFPDAGFIVDPQELGIKDLVEMNQCQEPKFIEVVDDFETLLDTCYTVAADKSCSTLVLDSMTGFEKLCFIRHCEEYFEGDWSSKGFYSYQQGPKNAAKRDLPRFLEALDKVREEGINVVLIGHSTVKSFSDPTGPDYERFIPYVDKETWAQIHRWANMVLFYNYVVDIDKSGPKNKARTESDGRALWTSYSPAFDAKNRHGLEPFIEAGDDGAEAYTNFEAAFRKACGE